MHNVRWVVWFKDGYWYCADILTMDTWCGQDEKQVPPIRYGVRLLMSNGGARYYAHD